MCERQPDRDRPYWYGKGYAFFSNQACEYYPCHPVPEGTEFNCLFCYCPLYMLGPDCGGKFTYLENGCKDCSGCVRPHLRENYGEIVQCYQKIQEAMAAQAKGRRGESADADRKQEEVET